MAYISEALSLPEATFAFSVKVRPAHGNLPAPPTIGASEIVAPAPSIGSPDVSRYAVTILCTAGNNRHGQS